MTLDELVEQHVWGELKVEIDGAVIDFVVFPWNEVEEREDDGGSNVWEYFIGWDGDVHDAVKRGEYVPFGAGNMYAGALKYDGGFQEMGHRGMLFADANGSVIYYDHNEGGPAKVVATSLDALVS